MKAVLSRVTQASVEVDGQIVGAIDGGLLALVGVDVADDEKAWETMARKIAELRILDGEQSVEQVQGKVLLVSQFTLLGATAKGRRPSWSQAAPGHVAEPVIAKIAQELRRRGIQVEEGRFGAYMKVSSVNDGPFTVLVET